MNVGLVDLGVWTVPLISCRGCRLAACSFWQLRPVGDVSEPPGSSAGQRAG